MKIVKTADYEGEDRRVKCTDCKSGEWNVYRSITGLLLVAALGGGFWGLAKASTDSTQDSRLATLERSLESTAREQKEVNREILRKLDEIKNGTVQNQLLIREHLAQSNGGRP